MITHESNVYLNQLKYIFMYIYMLNVIKYKMDKNR